MDDERLAACQETIGYEFREPWLLDKALTHSSTKRAGQKSNERLEFLGDSVLAMVVSQRIFEIYPDHTEGEMTKIKSVVVSGKTLAKVSKKIGLYAFMAIGKGITSRPKIPRSVHGNVLEAVIGAVYLDGGLEPARRFVLAHLDEEIGHAAANRHGTNFKSLLQQYAQRYMSLTPTYRVVSEEGPDHGKSFEVIAVIGEQEYDTGRGNSKKDAEQNAAQATLKMLKEERGDETDDEEDDIETGDEANGEENDADDDESVEEV